MGNCKDRREDIDVMKFLAERNAAKSTDVPFYLMDIMWEGSLLDIQFHVVELENVISVNQVQKGNFIATVKFPKE